MTIADVVEALDKLTREVAALKKAAKKPDRAAWKPREVAEKLGLEYETVLDLIHSGQIRAVEINGRYLVPDDELRRLLALPESA
ncbi:helix-turn-helix domain-containing protein [Amycolatopsis taiwanensis]|uniref:helix-turn-helix domain-containing protein n=1 Tax=Amycolatopsis taiwanensis TaxID=342230 RepID=UPI00048605DE|nr:helix-turn-helix domain-containing protein [Amycolatopsis taiwanensis]